MVLMFLIRWVATHIKVDDRALRAYIEQSKITNLEVVRYLVLLQRSIKCLAVIRMNE